jgi:16S rRNA (uracil1498-N3)-methyltransferase
MVLVQALAKGDRDEMAVQAACELGVDEIVPWQAARSVSRWEGPKAAKGRERWASIVREAAKQAHRAWVPEVAPVHSTAQLVERAADARLLVLDPWTETRLTGIRPDGRDLVLVVGPEGGIAPEELERLEAAGAERVRLGDTVLRTSTAGPAAIAVLSANLGRW